jgi:hypothetical protein
MNAPTALREYLGDGIPVLTDLDADHCLRRLAEIAADLAACERAAAEEKARIDAWVEMRQVQAEEESAEYAAALEAYTRSRIGPDAKRKSILLPGGTVALRKEKPKWHWPKKADDPDGYAALTVYARERGAIRVTVKAEGPAAISLEQAISEHAIPSTAEEAPDLDALKACCAVRDGIAIDQETGEPVPATTVEDNLPDRFDWRLAPK